MGWSDQEQLQKNWRDVRGSMVASSSPQLIQGGVGTPAARLRLFYLTLHPTARHRAAIAPSPI